MRKYIYIFLLLLLFKPGISRAQTLDGMIGFGQYEMQHPDKFFSTLEGYNSINVPQIFLTRQMLIGNTLRLARNVYFLSGIM